MREIAIIYCASRFGNNNNNYYILCNEKLYNDLNKHIILHTNFISPDDILVKKLCKIHKLNEYMINDDVIILKTLLNVKDFTNMSDHHNNTQYSIYTYSIYTRPLINYKLTSDIGLTLHVS